MSTPPHIPTIIPRDFHTEMCVCGGVGWGVGVCGCGGGCVCVCVFFLLPFFISKHISLFLFMATRHDVICKTGQL